jgi:hypothetical protein
MDIGNAIAAANLAASILVAIVVYKGSRLIGMLQIEREIRVAWMTVDQQALQCDEILECMDRLLHPGDDDLAIETRRKRWICYMLRNPLENMYMSIEAGLVRDSERSLASLKASLRPLVRDDSFLTLVNNYTSDPHFVKLCQSMRREMEDEDGRPAAALD